MQSFDFKKLLPHVYIIIGFAALALLYCYPALQGKVLNQHDNISWKAMYHETEAYHDSTGINPLWTNSMFGGMPNYTIGIPENKNYVGHLQTVLIGFLAKPAHFLFLAMLCFYVLMLVMKIDRWLALIGSIAYAFATYNVVIISAGHDTKMLAIGYMPAVFAGFIMVFRGKWLTGAALLGISMALLVGTNHYQVLYYAFIMLGFYWIGKLISTIQNKGNFKQFILATLLSGIIAGIGLGTSMASILTTKEYAKTTMRGGESELTINHDANKKAGGLDKDYAFQWSNGIGETFCLLIPNLYGGSSSMPIDKAPETEALVGTQASAIPMYWGPQPFVSGPVYFGAIVCFLFVLGMLVIRSSHKWWILSVCVLTILMSWGKNLAGLNYWLFDHLPMYNKFRTPTMILVVPQLLFPLVGIWGLSEILRKKFSDEEVLKKMKIAVGLTAGICVLLGVGGSMFFDFSNPTNDAQLPQQIMGALKSDRASLATKSGLTSAVFIILAAGLIWAFIKSKANKTILIAGIGILVAVDLISVDKNFLGEGNYEDATDYEALFQPRPVDKQIMQDKDPYYRVLDLSKNTYNDAVQAYFHKCIGGYSPAKMEIYQDLIDMQMGGSHTQGKFNSQVLNMLNTKYIIFNAGQQGPVYQPNSAALGNAWFVSSVKWAKTADEEMNLLHATSLGDTAIVTNEFDPKSTAILRDHYHDQLNNYTFSKDSTSSIKLLRYGLNDLIFESNNTQNGLAVFSDIWYPYGWEATIDGKPAEILRVNYVLRALKVPANSKRIEFHFRPSSFTTGNNIAMVSSLTLIALLFIGIYAGIKQKEPGSITDDL
ncbi:MAG: YfhO family protein [Bacteroidetes bacterium]|nr:YfhO family protein [Bacteroidota bacterium]